jgi:hypothetical protein
MVPAEDVERQVTVVAVVAVEEAPLLVAVHRIVGRIQIEHQLGRRRRVRGQERRHEPLRDRRAVIDDLLVPRRRRGIGRRELQAVEGALPGQGMSPVLCPPPGGSPMRSGARWSAKHAANDRSNPVPAATSRNNSTPPASVVTQPPSNAATTARRPHPWNVS